MGRKRLPNNKKKEVVGVSLPPHIIKRLETLGAHWDGMAASGVSRELLLLGLTLVDSLEANGAPMPYLNLTDAYRRPPQNENTDHRQKQTTHVQPQPDATPSLPLTPHTRRLKIETIDDLANELRQLEADPAQATKADFLRELIADLRARERACSSNELLPDRQPNLSDAPALHTRTLFDTRH